MTPSILSETEELLKGIAEDASARMILIHKTRSRNLDKRFRLLPVEIDDAVFGAFRESTRLTLEEVRDNAASITKFSDPTNTNSYLEMDTELLPDLNALVDELRWQDSYHGSHNFEEVKEKGISCFVHKSGPGQKRMFVFFNVGKNHLRPDKYIISKLTGDGLRIDKDKLVVFENRAFAVYYEDLQRLLIISYRSAKKLLDFNEQFKTKCRDIFDGPLERLVSLEADDPDTLLGSSTTNEKIVKMHGRGVFDDADLEAFAEWNAFYRRKPLEDTRRIDLGADGKAAIRDRDDLEMVLRVLNKDIVEAVNSRGSYALATGKKELKVSSSSTAERLAQQVVDADHKSAGRPAGREEARPRRRGARRAPGSRRGAGTVEA